MICLLCDPAFLAVRDGTDWNKDRRKAILNLQGGGPPAREGGQGMRSLSQGILNHISFGRTSGHVRRIQTVSYVVLLMLLVICLPALSDIPHDFGGTVLGVSDQNGLYVEVTQPGTTGLGGSMHILLKQPVPNLFYFLGSELQFDILGHDILGRLVCDAYLAGGPIQDVYYCGEYPDVCAFYGPHFRGDLYNWDRSPIYHPL